MDLVIEKLSELESIWRISSECGDDEDLESEDFDIFKYKPNDTKVVLS